MQVCLDGWLVFAENWMETGKDVDETHVEPPISSTPTGECSDLYIVVM
jgi:hypothetical protein